MNILNDKKHYGIIGRVGNLTICKIRCRESKFNSFKSNTTVKIRMSQGIYQMTVLNKSNRVLKNGTETSYVTFTIAAEHNCIEHMLLLFKIHDLSILQEDIRNRQLTLGML